MPGGDERCVVRDMGFVGCKGIIELFRSVSFLPRF
jgi:hypothetical protein